MNDNKNSLSKKLEEVFEHMDKISDSCRKIESCINQENKRLQLLINPDKDADISKEIKFYMVSFLKKITDNLEKYDKSLH
jgi:hypothetical protein